jgi:phosphoribosylformylglycinamidine synthase II
MLFHIEVARRQTIGDPDGRDILEQARELGINTIEAVRTASVFVIQGLNHESQAEAVAEQLLADPLAEEYAIGRPILVEGMGQRIAQVLKKPGVMEPAAASVLKGIHDLGLSAEKVRIARKYQFEGELEDEELESLAKRVLANDVIEDVLYGNTLVPMLPDGQGHEFKLVTVSLTDADEGELMRISRDGCLSLNLEEMKTIQAYFADLGREPTDAELESLAQTWSEHCVHKTLKGDILFEGELIENLLKSTICKATDELDKPWCVSVFVDNAGIIEFDDEYNVCFKVETHNHPSAIEPYGGSATGIGGVIRDILGTGLGAKPILNTDVFCFAPPDTPQESLLKGVMHPKRLMKGVVSGVRDYGNRMGIPTANGALFFDKRYLGNPLVYCGDVGLIPKDRCVKKVHPGDKIVAVGGRTGRDGIHGATFSSIELTEESEMSSSGAVQIGNAITEKKVMDVLLQARDRGLYRDVTDCGAGGFSSAVGEMGENSGAEVHLDTIPLKYDGLTYTEIWISEAQERMVVAVPPENEEEFHALIRSEDVESTSIGSFTDTGRLVLNYHGTEVANIEMKFLHDGLPRLKREAVFEKPQNPEPERLEKDDYTEELKALLASWNICSKEWVIRQYDHEVQGTSVLKPLVGVDNDGPGDAAVIAPVLGSNRGVIVSNGMSPKFGDIDPYAMAASAIDEALRNIIAVGGNLDRVALLDNFCWGNTDKPDRLGSLVLAAQACHDMALAYGTPFISGKDSLNNEYQAGDENITIPPSLLISAIAVIDDVSKCVSMDAKEAGNLIYVVGLTKKELGGSHYFEMHGHAGNDAPQVDAALSISVMNAIAEATAAGLVRSCHDCCEGGMAVAAAEMAFAGGLGMALNIESMPTDSKLRADEILFSESTGRFICEVNTANNEKFETTLRNVPFGCIGAVNATTDFVIRDGDTAVVRDSLENLKESWQKPLRW